MTLFNKLLVLAIRFGVRGASAPRVYHLEPLVFRDPTDDGPEVEILREGKVIVRQGDEFVLSYLYPYGLNRMKTRYY